MSTRKVRFKQHHVTWLIGMVEGQGRQHVILYFSNQCSSDTTSQKRHLGTVPCPSAPLTIIYLCRIRAKCPDTSSKTKTSCPAFELRFSTTYLEIDEATPRLEPQSSPHPLGFMRASSGRFYKASVTDDQELECLARQAAFYAYSFRSLNAAQSVYEAVLAQVQRDRLETE